MNKLALFVTGLGCFAVSSASLAESKVQDDVYTKAYALYALYHPDNKEQSGHAIIKQMNQDYANLFKTNSKVNAEQYVQYEQARLDPLMKQRREMSLKQTYVRYGILDKNKDQKLTLKEFQETGMKTFAEFDKNQDGIVNVEDAKLSQANTGTHDGFKVKLPISMPMPSNVQEFIQQYGQGKNYVTLGDYLTARDKQYFDTDLNKDQVVTEKEYVDEFMARFDSNNIEGKEKMKELFTQQFNVISKAKSTIQAKDIDQFAKKVDQAISK